MGKELVEKQNTAVALMAADMEADAGAGFENVSTKDVSIPYLSLAQALSDKVKKGPDKVAGLEEGDFFNAATLEIFKPGTFRVIPCGFQKRWIEKDSLGKEAFIIAIHESEDCTKNCVKNAKGKLETPAGTFVIPTAMHFVLVLKEDGTFQAGVISLSNSQLKRSKNWLALMQGLKVKTPTGLKTPAMFSHSYLVKSIQTRNDEGSWMLWDFSAPQALTSPDLYAQAKSFQEEIKRGSIKVSEPPKDDETKATSDHF